MLLQMIILACAGFIEKKNLCTVKFSCSVLIKAPGKRLIRKILNPSKSLTSVKLMFP